MVPVIYLCFFTYLLVCQPPVAGIWTRHSAFDMYLQIEQLARQAVGNSQSRAGRWHASHLPTQFLLGPVAERRSRNTSNISCPHLGDYVAFTESLGHLISTMYHFIEGKTKALMGEAACPALVANHWLHWAQGRCGCWIPSFPLAPLFSGGSHHPLPHSRDPRPLALPHDLEPQDLGFLPPNTYTPIQPLQIGFSGSKYYNSFRGCC